MNQVIIAGLPVVRMDGTELARCLLENWQIQMASGRTLPPKLVFSVNGQGIALWSRNRLYRDIMSAADYRHADGQSVVFASRWLARAPIPARTATTDFFHDAARIAQKHRMTFYMLGAREENNTKAVMKIRELYPGLKVVGHHGYFGAKDKDNWTAVLADIRATQPDVVWLAFGKPLQEELCVWLKEELPGVTWLKPCGGLFEFLSGDAKAKRAPTWMQRAGLEWLFRLSLDPRRLFWRYLVTNLIAIWAMVLGTWLDRKSGSISQAFKPVEAKSGDQ